MEEYVLNAVFGLIVGFIGGYAGIGGAPLLVFLLGMFLGYSQHMAQGTVVAIMLGPMTLPAVYVMWERVKPRKWYILAGVLTYAFFSYFGAEFAYLFSNQGLRILFACLLVALGLRYIQSQFTKKDNPESSANPKPLIPLNMYTIIVLGAVVGVAGGLFGIGAGVLMVPLLIWLFRLHKDDARAISLAILLPPVSVGAVVKYDMQGDVLWPMVLIGFFAYMASNYWGAKLGKIHNPKRFSIFLGILLLVLGITYGLMSLWLNHA